MALKPEVIQINSILGGHSPATHFSGQDQFLTSYSIDPSYGIEDSSQDTGSIPSGLLRPIGAVEVNDGTLNGPPMWIRSQPKDSTWYIYDAVGSVYSAGSAFTTITGIGDLNDGGTSEGNGMAYYDNYMYFSRSTTIARYGPLNGTPAFTDDYFVGTLGLTALSDTNYPSPLHVSVEYPNHVLHRHVDGALYIADVVDEQGTIHFIRTKKTTVEGDTDDGSTYDKVSVGYGLYPTAMESYGEFLVISFIESFNGQSGVSLDSATTAKVAFWDTTSKDVNNLIWVEYPDQTISAIKNVNGVLHFISGTDQQNGFRVLRYVGGSTFEEVFYSHLGSASLPGAVDGEGDRLVFGSKNEVPLGTTGSGENACVWQLGLKQKALGQGLFNVRSTTNNSDVAMVTALRLEHNDDFNQTGIIVGWGDTTGTDYGIDRPSTTYSSCDTQWYSQIYKIGSPFKIRSIRIPLAQKLTANMTVIPFVWIDGINDSNPDYTQLTTINSTNYGTNKRSIVLRPTDLKGDYSFCLSFRWTGTELCVIGLPIIIEYEFVAVDNHIL